MKQEDVNELISMNPSTEAKIQFETRKKEAIERGCMCCESAGFFDSKCFIGGHKQRDMRK